MSLPYRKVKNVKLSKLRRQSSRKLQRNSPYNVCSVKRLPQRQITLEELVKGRRVFRRNESLSHLLGELPSSEQDVPQCREVTHEEFFEDQLRSLSPWSAVMQEHEQNLPKRDVGASEDENMRTSPPVIASAIERRLKQLSEAPPLNHLSTPTTARVRLIHPTPIFPGRRRNVAVNVDIIEKVLSVVAIKSRSPAPPPIIPKSERRKDLGKKRRKVNQR